MQTGKPNISAEIRIETETNGSYTLPIDIIIKTISHSLQWGRRRSIWAERYECEHIVFGSNEVE